MDDEQGSLSMLKIALADAFHLHQRNFPSLFKERLINAVGYAEIAA